MKVRVEATHQRLLFDFELEADDPLEVETDKGRVRFGGVTAHVDLPFDDALAVVHPDLLALSATLMSWPHIGSALEMPFPVSRPFASVYHERTGKRITPVSDELPPRRPPPNSVPALAYSGGVDSTAALALMPAHTVCVFLDRDQSDDPRSLYDKRAAHHACTGLEELGRQVYRVPTNLEYLRQPKGFPVHWAHSVPILLLADFLGFDSVAAGMVLETAYGIGHERFEDFLDAPDHRIWGGGLFEACGLPFNLVTAGLSEVATALVVDRSPYSHLAQSCMRGSVGAPCNDCWKCFRKNLLNDALAQEALDWNTLEAMFSIREARRYLRREPVEHENVLAYAVKRCRGDHAVLDQLRHRLAGSWQTTDWMEKWYPRSGELITPSYRDEVERTVRSLLEVMTDAEQREIESMDRATYLKSEARSRATRAFAESLARYDKRWPGRMLGRWFAARQRR